MVDKSTQIDHVPRTMFIWIIGGMFATLLIVYTVLNRDIEDVEQRSVAEDSRIEARLEAQDAEISVIRSDIRQILEVLARIEANLE